MKSEIIDFESLGLAAAKKKLGEFLASGVEVKHHAVVRSCLILLYEDRQVGQKSFTDVQKLADALWETKVADIFSDRVSSSLGKANIVTLGQLCPRGEAELLKNRYFDNRRQLEEVKNKLFSLGLRLHGQD